MTIDEIIDRATAAALAEIRRQNRENCRPAAVDFSKAEDGSRVLCYEGFNLRLAVIAAITTIGE